MLDSENFPYGDARFADEREIARAFRKSGGFPFGFYGRRRLHHSSSAGALIVGGAGSGKFTTVFSHIALSGGGRAAPPRYLVFDPKGEIAATIGPGLIHQGAHVFYINPFDLHGLPNHSVDVLAHLDAGSPYLAADTRTLAKTLVPSIDGPNKFFTEMAQQWLAAIIRAVVILGGVSFSRLSDVLALFRSDYERANAFLDTIIDDLSEEDFATFREMIAMRDGGGNTYGGVMGEITTALDFMTIPQLKSSFMARDAGAEFSMDVLTAQSARPVYVFILLPASVIGACAPALRQCFSALRIEKERKPESPVVTMLIDEAAQLKTFPEVSDFYVIGRGSGLRPICAYQDIGQIYANLGPHGATALTNSTDLEIYLGGGLSDANTARTLSERLGQATIGVPDTLTQARARQEQAQLTQAAISGQIDPVDAGLQMGRLHHEMDHRRKQGIALMSASQIANLDRGKALIIPSGYDIRPFLADKRAYFDLPGYAGRYFPNPYFDREDMDSVMVRGRFLRRRRRVIVEDVPAAFADFPQYIGGKWSYIAGYRPKV